MINLEFSQSAVDLESTEFKQELKKIKTKEVPAFMNYQPPIEAIQKITERFKGPKNIIIIANGGSRSSFYGFYHALTEFRNPEKQVCFVNTMEPDYLIACREQFPPETSLVIPISKSGTNVDVLEPLMYFSDYPVLAVTGQTGVLQEMAKRKKWTILEHPEIGGRFSGLTSSALGPAALVGLPLEEIVKGAINAYQNFHPTKSMKDNLALKLAGIFYHLEKQGYIEIFTPFYSFKLFAFYPLLVQLIHETCGKNDQGQTVFGDLAPESQHHTNQRFFGGRKNVAGLFFTVNKQTHHDLQIEVPTELQDINLRSGTLKHLDKLNLQTGLDFDFRGVRQDAELNKIPYAVISLDQITPETIGEFLAFLQCFAVYSAWLRDIEPFNQPQVERAKEITFELIKNKARE